MSEAPGHSEVLKIVAPNPGPMTLDGTRTYVVGFRRPLVIDPGPAIDTNGLPGSRVDAKRAGMTATA